MTYQGTQCPKILNKNQEKIKKPKYSVYAGKELNLALYE